MDVVKRTIESLRGSLELSSPPGQGSQVALRIPLTLAIIDGLLVRVGGARYVIPLSSVEECLELSTEQDLRSTGRSLLTIRENLVPFVRLRELFRTGTPPDRYQKIVVISTGTDRVGLAVDPDLGQLPDGDQAALRLSCGGRRLFGGHDPRRRQRRTHPRCERPGRGGGAKRPGSLRAAS